MSLLKFLVLAIVGTGPKRYLDSARKLSDAELVDKILETKDSQLFGILYDRYSNKVYNKCYSFVRSTDEAKDLTQDIFLKVFLKLNTYNSAKAAFSTWLYTLAYNFCTNYVTRDRKKLQRNEAIEDHEYHIAVEEEIDISEINQLDPEKLDKALGIIPPEDKSLLLLKYQDDTPIKELQESLGLSASAVKMRLNRAKLKVVKLYETL